MSSSTAPSSRHSPSGVHSPKDKMYGQRDLAQFVEFCIGSLFAPLNQQREGVDTPPLSPASQAQATRKDPPPLVEFIAYALYRTRLPTAITHQALVLLKRLKKRYPTARGTASSPHRLFLSSLMLSSKISMDDTYSNKSWAIVGGNYFPLKEVNQMERELFAFLEFNVKVENEELQAYVKEQQAAWQLYNLHKLSYGPSSQEVTSDKKRRRSETLGSQEAIREEEAARHKRASDAAMALLGSNLGRVYKRSAQRKTFCDSSFRSCSSSSSNSSSSSSANSPSTPEYRDSSGQSSAYSSAATSPAVSTPNSPLSPSSYPPKKSIVVASTDLGDTCNRFGEFLTVRRSP